MLQKLAEGLFDALMVAFGVALLAMISIAAICGSVLLVKATYESVVHWDQPRPWERVQ